MIFCPKCGLRNEDDDEICTACGSKLRKRPRFAGQEERKVEEQKSEGIATPTKLLIIAVIVLIAGIGLTYGFILKSGDMTNPSQASTPATGNTPSQTNSQATWHKIASFTGTGEETRTVDIKGDHFKVIMSAVPQVSYDINAFSIDVLKGDAGVATGTINWGATEKPVRKEHVIQVKEGKGPYNLYIQPSDIASWSVTVWDYY
ncbi:MAG: zinc-ribbon domain-containing protein [Methanobacterium sp.]|uniref:zinc-ribbon domain-containing protein n=1 Tax=Methanobacterium sp. TaxID=2164 RepID=UPI003D657F42|nr:zinc-ribbon domain-containing protein [Methanobacterium sp.]